MASSAFSVDGLVSGLDTTSLINQLMTAERQPQVRLQSRKTGLQGDVDIYRSLNTKFQAIETAAQDLAAPTGWQSAAATSSDPTVATVATTAGASQAALAFHVNALAAAHALISSPTTIDPTAAGTITGPVAITVGTTTTTISSLGDGSLNATAAAITASTAGVTATVVQLSTGQYAMQLTSKTTGAASTFTATGLGAVGTLSVLSQGADASLTVGDPLGVHYNASSATNSFTGLLPGTTITVVKPGDAAVTVSADPKALSDKVQKLVTAINDATSFIRSNAGYDASTKQAGALLGDSTASTLSSQLIDSVISSVGGSSISATSAGISVDRDGTVTFDSSKFLATYQTNPTGLTAMFQAGDPTVTTDDGIAERVRLVAHQATDVVSGSITSAITSRTDQIKTLDQSISDWDVRLTLKQDGLKRQFADLETALSKMRSQSSWLAGQIASLH